MGIHLVTCHACARHIRASEGACPFCHALNIAPPQARPTPTQRLGRAALFAFGAAVSTSVALTGCSESSAPTPDAAADSRVMEGGIVPPYGTPVDDAGPAPAYGTPPPEAGPAPPYGAPPDGGV